MVNTPYCAMEYVGSDFRHGPKTKNTLPLQQSDYHTVVLL